MTRRRWIADEFDDHRAALVGAHAAHLANVLRARVGQEFDVAAGARVRRGRVLSVSPDRVEFELGHELRDEDLRDGELRPAAAVELTLLLAVIKFDRFEWAVEKLTELGAARIVPVIAARSARHLAAAAEKRTERWRRIAREAAEQSRRAAPPEISAPAKLKAALTPHAGLRFVLAETEQQRTLREALAQSDGITSVALAIGPEGGWTQSELQQFAGTGWRAVTLGTNILRAETAAIAATAALQAIL